MSNYLRLFFISFLFAYNGGLLNLIVPPNSSIHTTQLIIALFGLLLIPNIKVTFKQIFLMLHMKESFERIKLNKIPLLIFLLFILFFQFNQSVKTPNYSSYKMSLLWWNFVGALIFIIGIKNKAEFYTLVLFGLFQIVVGIISSEIDFSSFQGAGEPIVVGRMGGILLCFALYFNKSNFKLIRIFMGSIGFLFIIVSGTRTIFISFAVIIAFLLLLNPLDGRFVQISSKTLKRISITILSLFLLVIVLKYNILGINSISISRFFDAFESLSNFSGHDTATIERAMQWSSALKSWRDAPIIGNGLGSFAYYSHGMDIRSYPHNIIMELLAEGGIVGLLLFFLLVISVWKILKSNWQITPIFINKFLISTFLLGLITALSSLEIPNQFIFFLSTSLILSSNSINALCKE